MTAMHFLTRRAHVSLSPTVDVRKVAVRMCDQTVSRDSLLAVRRDLAWMLAVELSGENVSQADWLSNDGELIISVFLSNNKGVIGQKYCSLDPFPVDDKVNLAGENNMASWNSQTEWLDFAGELEFFFQEGPSQD